GIPARGSRFSWLHPDAVLESASVLRSRAHWYVGNREALTTEVSRKSAAAVSRWCRRRETYPVSLFQRASGNSLAAFHTAVFAHNPGYQPPGERPRPSGRSASAPGFASHTRSARSNYHFVSAVRRQGP